MSLTRLSGFVLSSWEFSLLLLRRAASKFHKPYKIIEFTFEKFPPRLANPLLVGLLIGYFIDNPHNFSHNDAYLIATGICLTLLMPVLFFHPFMLFLFKQGMKLRIACCSLIYTKVIISKLHFLTLTLCAFPSDFIIHKVHNEGRNRRSSSKSHV